VGVADMAKSMGINSAIVSIACTGKTEYTPMTRELMTNMDYWTHARC